MAASARGHRALPPVRWSSWPTSIDSRRLQQFRQFLARVEHARFDRILGNSNDLGDLLNRFLMIVDEIDDLPMLRCQRGQAFAQDRALVLLCDGRLRTISR